MLPTLRSDGDLFEGPARGILEDELLVPYLARQRWFGGKARQIGSACFADWAPVAGASHPVFLTIVEVRYADGTSERYQLPLAILSADLAAGILSYRSETVLARFSGRRSDLLCDAVMDDEACRLLLDAVQRGTTFGASLGTVVARPTDAAPPSAAEPALEVSRMPSVHSNSAVMFGGRYLLKLFRRVEPGINPDIEIGRFLAHCGHQVHVPALIGSIEYVDRSGLASGLALVQTLVPSPGNAWEHALAELAAYLTRARAIPGRPTPSASREIMDGYLDTTARLALRTAELHRALASGTTDPDFTPERTSHVEVEELVRRVHRRAGETLDLLVQRMPSFDDGSREMAQRLLERRATLLERLEQLGRRTDAFVKIRVHGDYHLGQVLRVRDDFVIIDFEGEPTRSRSDRRAKQSPLRDLAGMLRSLSYAAHSALIAAAESDAGARAQLAPWASSWEAWTSTTFLQAYLDAAKGAVFMPSDSALIRAPLEMFLLEKALYEVDYEMNNRPEWVSVPLAGVQQMLDASGPGFSDPPAP
jgi:maltose alpha-D-glucosyltransferase / alpha-amylase